MKVEKIVTWLKLQRLADDSLNSGATQLRANQNKLRSDEVHHLCRHLEKTLPDKPCIEEASGRPVIFFLNVLNIFLKFDPYQP